MKMFHVQLASVRKAHGALRVNERTAIIFIVINSITHTHLSALQIARTSQSHSFFHGRNLSRLHGAEADMPQGAVRET